MRALTGLLALLLVVGVGATPPSERDLRDGELMWLALETRDSLTGAHCWRVGELAARLAPSRGQDPELARLAGRLHDLGKLTMPDHILRGRGRLSEADRTLVNLHPIQGRKLARKADLHPGLTSAIGSHHERWDGEGYPDRLAGEEIPALTRVVSVADVIDAITARRTYKPALPLSRAMAVLQAQRGRQFDPVVVDRALELREELGTLVAGWQDADTGK